MNKKGSLSLSIEAIVIIVIGITILGLGLGFVRSLFGDIEGLRESTFQKISEQLSTDLATSSAPLLFSQTKLSLERGDSSIEGFGVRNEGDTRIKYGFAIETFNCPPDAKGADGTCQSVADWFEFFKGDEQYTLKPAERQVNKVQISVPRSATTGLYLLKLSAYIGQWSPGCPGDYEGGAGSGCLLLGQTELFLEVS